MSLQYPWLESTWKSWQSRLETGRVPNAILVDSLNGYGADHLVELFSNATMCQNYESEACGFCHSCLLMQSGHPSRYTPCLTRERQEIDLCRSNSPCEPMGTRIIPTRRKKDHRDQSC